MYFKTKGSFPCRLFCRGASSIIFKAFLIALLLFFSFNYDVSAEKEAVNRNGEVIEPIMGERPFIDLNKVPSDAYEPGKIQIKLNKSLEGKILDNLITASADGYVITSQKDLDELNRIFSVQQYKPLLHNLYNVSPASVQYRERHMAWGFHLWFELTIDSKSDVIEAVRSYQKLSSVEIAEPVYKKQRILPTYASEPISVEDARQKSRYTPDDPMYADNQWHFNNTGQTIGGQTGTPGCDISAEDAWNIEKGWSNVIVAVIDGGIDFNHIELKPNMWPTIGPDGTGTQPCSENHGTHVGGTISVVTNNAIGIAGTAGGSGADDGSGNLGSGDGVRLMSLDLFDGSHGLSTLGMNIYAADNGAAISQNSWGWGTPGYYETSDLQGIDYFNQHGGGSVMSGGLTVFAAGNSNSNSNWYPAYYSGAMAVAGTDNRDIRYSSSNYGSWVEISAPAVNVYSTYNDNYVGFMTGTSMACPHVSGVAALIASYSARNGLILTATQVRNILKDTTDDHYPLNPSYTGMLGTGRLNAHAALLEVQGMLNDYSLSLFADPADAGITLIGAGNYEEGNLVNIQALTDTYVFVEWTGAPADVALLANPNSSSTSFNMPARNVSYTAVFEEPVTEYLVTLYADPPDIGIDLTGGGYYTAGSTVYIQALLQKGFIFVEWVGDPGDVELLDDKNSPQTQFNMPERDVTLTALFEEEIEPIDGTEAAISLEQESIKGIWLWSYVNGKSQDIESKGSNWVRILEGIPASKIMAGDISDDGNLEIIALLPGHGLWYYSLTSSHWSNIVGDASGVELFTLAKSTPEGPVEVIASFSPAGLRKWTFNGSWTTLMAVEAETLSAGNVDRDTNSVDELLVAFKGYNSLYVYTFATGKFNRIIEVSPSQITAGDITGDGYIEMVCVFDGYGIYMVRYIPDKNESMKALTEKSGQFDLIRDIPFNSEWVSMDKSGKGFQFNRITWGTPDAGHHVATGDIAGHSGENVIFTYNNKTYYYSYDTKGWSTLVEAPMKRIITGKFTDGEKDDVIACETVSGSLYLRRTATGAWEQIVANGNTNAMAPLE